jgi:energy-coupling factor transport system substrate-specific component
MSWELASFLILGAVLAGGFAWYERSRPSSQVVALVAALAALAVAGRVAFAALPNVVATTDIVVFAGFALGAAPGFAVGALAGLVSNFWLGQGPWTPWEMAGWGLCGILGALLAGARPHPNRFTLAAVCALAGVGYGALLNFSLMATYGGDLSLGRFLALESRAVPFDAAHAIGNATLALVAGPAIVRMLVRFRERFQWRAPAVASLLALALALAAVLPAPARASAQTSRAAAWLASAQNSDGGWGASRDADSKPDLTAWVMLGLEAAGRNPLDLSRGGRTPVDYLRSKVRGLGSAGDFARTILALKGAGVNPRDFGGRNLVAALAKRRRSNGSFEGWPGSTAFAIIALRASGSGGGLDRSISWLAKAQNDDGGWGDTPGSPSTADGTGAAIQAIPGSDAASRGLAYLRKAQRPGGGFALGGSGGVNSQSTAWAAQGMIALGTDPANVEKGGKSALDYLSARQDGDGHYRYSASSDQTPVWVTGQALAATAGKSFPIAAPPRQPQSKAPKATPPQGAAPDSGSSLAPTAPPSALPDLPATPGQGGSATPTPAPPGSGGSPGKQPPATEGAPAAPPSGGALPEGAEPRTTPPPVAPPFEASDNPGPKPWAPLGIGLGSSGVALGGVLLLGRRFGW